MGACYIRRASPTSQPIKTSYTAQNACFLPSAAPGHRQSRRLHVARRLLLRRRRGASDEFISFIREEGREAWNAALSPSTRRC
uniref:Uncharacterized protein n=1 Tax=Arundo donax TaxID=35708 RepID=A0A0A9FQY5_ARUDO